LTPPTALSTTLVVWGTADIFFNVMWAQWLAEAIPVRVEEVAGGKMFFPEERAAEFSEKVSAHWRAAMRQT
jgi:pimeloyl-ACP methyl ester carboxylesterase